MADYVREDELTPKRMLYDIFTGTAYGNLPLRECLNERQLVEFDKLDSMPTEGDVTDPDVIRWDKDDYKETCGG